MIWLMAVIVLTALTALGVRWLGPMARQHLALALRSLLLRKLRSLLSVLGIIIGTASVIVLTAFGEGSMRDALEDIKQQGATNLLIVSVRPPEEGAQRATAVVRYGLTQEDYERFTDTLRPTIVAALPLRTFPAEVRPVTGPRSFQGRIIATQARYADLYRLHGQVAAGRFLLEQDEAQVANVAVLGADVAAELFPGEDPLRHTIKIRDRAFEVIGVLKDRTPRTGSGGAGERYNADIYIPLSAWRARLGQLLVTPTADSFLAEDVPLSQVVLTARDLDQVHPAATLIREQLRQFHPRGDVELRIPLDRLEAAERTRDRYRLLLFFIAGISLAVGGIGIMNIMLATVTERTREIGVRRALGANRRDITRQFLVEAVVQTGLGGLIGMSTGFAILASVPGLYQFWQRHIARLPSVEMQTLPVQLHVPSVILALGVAVAVGVAFGWYPARRAALLDPVEALRHE